MLRMIALLPTPARRAAPVGMFTHSRGVRHVGTAIIIARKSSQLQDAAHARWRRGQGDGSRDLIWIQLEENNESLLISSP